MWTRCSPDPPAWRDYAACARLMALVAAPRAAARPRCCCALPARGAPRPCRRSSRPRPWPSWPSAACRSARWSTPTSCPCRCSPPPWAAGPERPHGPGAPPLLVALAGAVLLAASPGRSWPRPSSRTARHRPERRAERAECMDLRATPGWPRSRAGSSSTPSTSAPSSWRARTTRFCPRPYHRQARGIVDGDALLSAPPVDAVAGLRDARRPVCRAVHDLAPSPAICQSRAGRPCRTAAARRIRRRAGPDSRRRRFEPLPRRAVADRRRRANPSRAPMRLPVSPTAARPRSDARPASSPAKAARWIGPALALLAWTTAPALAEAPAKELFGAVTRPADLPSRVDRLLRQGLPRRRRGAADQRPGLAGDAPVAQPQLGPSRR